MNTSSELCAYKGETDSHASVATLARNDRVDGIITERDKLGGFAFARPPFCLAIVCSCGLPGVPFP